MVDSVKIVNLDPSADAIGEIAREARASGHVFLDRLIADWHSGANRFDKPGECLLGLFDGDRLVAIGGLNRDPYTRAGGASDGCGTSMSRRRIAARGSAGGSSWSCSLAPRPSSVSACAHRHARGCGVLRELGLRAHRRARCTQSIDRTDAVGAES